MFFFLKLLISYAIMTGKGDDIHVCSKRQSRSSSLPSYNAHIEPTDERIYAKLSVSHHYLGQIGPIYAVIPENHMNKTFHISCRML